MHKITIEGVLNGWIVNVGCQTVVFDDEKVMLEEIGHYIKHPEEVEKKYMENRKNHSNSAPDVVEPAMQAEPALGRK